MAYQTPQSSHSVLESNDSTQGPALQSVIDVPPAQDNDPAWRGGEHNFEGPQDRFCFMCGAGENIVGCETCGRCYHSQCMFPPLAPSQVPDIWFCPVCVGRNWHIPPGTIQTPPTTLLSTSVSSTPVPSTNSLRTEQEQSACVINAEGIAKQIHDQPQDPSGNSETQSQRWKDTQRWKENSRHAPRGYILDPSSAESFIPLQGDGPSIQLSTIIQNSSGLTDEVQNSGVPANNQHRSDTSSRISERLQKSRPARKSEGSISPPRKRSKYSDLPTDIERALGLIASTLRNVSQYKKAQDGIENNSRGLEQKIRIQEGEVLLCRQELQAGAERLSAALSEIEMLKAENINLRKEVENHQALIQKKETEMKNWQNMLRTMMGTGEGLSTS